MQQVWIFNGQGAAFPSAVFTTREAAEEWIARHNLQGTLTQYPVNISSYDFAIENGWFTPKHEYQHSPAFIQRFSSASQEHYHFDNDDADA